VTRTPGTGARRSRAPVLLLSALALAALLASLGWGAVSVRPDQILGVVLERAGVDAGIEFTAQQRAVLWNIRLPRALLSALVGAALAAAGVALQAAFRNQLADPALLGVSGAATLGVVLAYAFGLVTTLGRWALPAAACLAALVGALWLLRYAARHAGSDRLTLILAGVALQLFLGGVATLLVNAVRRPGMPDASFLTLGGLTVVFWRDVGLAAVVVALVAALLVRRAPVMNILLLDDGTARTLGVDVARQRALLAGLAAVATGTVVAYGGSVAFVGLVVPFLLRRLLGDDHRVLVPAALLAGAVLVTLADALARNLFSPMEIPLGVLLTVVGGPLFFWLVGRGRTVGRW